MKADTGGPLRDFVKNLSYHLPWIFNKSLSVSIFETVKKFSKSLSRQSRNLD
jgi:hypothetical protein